MNEYTSVADAAVRLAGIYAPTGREEELSDYIAGLLPEGCDRGTDSCMNLIVRRPGPGKKIMITAPMDEPSFVVKEFDGRFGKIEAVGRTASSALLGKRLVFEGVPAVVGVTPVHLLSSEEKKTMPKPDSLYIEAAKPIEPGTFGTFYGRPERLGEGGFLLRTRSAAARCAIAAMLRTLHLTRAENDLYFVFAGCGALGIGAKAAAERIKPSAALILQGAESASGLYEKDPPSLALPVTDSGAVHDRRMLEILRKAAAEDETETYIPAARVSSPASSLAGLAGGIGTACIGIPNKFGGTASECCRFKDAEALCGLLLKAVRLL